MGTIAKSVARRFKAYILRVEPEPQLATIRVGGHVLGVDDLKTLLEQRLGSIRDVWLRRSPTGRAAWNAVDHDAKALSGTVDPKIDVLDGHVIVWLEVRVTGPRT